MPLPGRAVPAQPERSSWPAGAGMPVRPLPASTVRRIVNMSAVAVVDAVSNADLMHIGQALAGDPSADG